MLLQHLSASLNAERGSCAPCPPTGLSQTTGLAAQIRITGALLVCLQESLVKIAKKLKKNNVAVDIVSFGSEEDNTEKLDAFLEAVNSGDNSHLVSPIRVLGLYIRLFG